MTMPHSPLRTRLSTERRQQVIAAARRERPAGEAADDCSLEDIQYHLYVLEKVRRGLHVADTRGTVPQAEAEARLHRWLTQ